MRDDARRILKQAEQETDAFLDILRQFVSLESPSHESKEASDKCARFYQDLLASHGWKTRLLPREDCGDQIVAEYGEGDGGVLLLGHYDTVFPLGSMNGPMPWRVADGKAHGPGVLDMKGGLLQAVFAVKILRDLGLAPARKLRLYANSDEESGSRSSHAAIRDLALSCDFVLVLEAGLTGLGDLKTSRSGRAVYTITAHGRSAHSGIAPRSGISPIIELARHIPFLDALCDHERGTTVVPTSLHAGVDGTAMVPGQGTLALDVRAVEEEEMARVTAAIEGLAPALDGMRLEINGGVEKLPYAFNDRNRELFERADALAGDVGIRLQRNHVGGGSDGNFTSPAGVPTLDGLGMTGDFVHNPGEYITIAHIAPRTALLAHLLRGL